MKISRIRSQILVLPQEDPLANTPEDPSAARPMVIVRLDTDDGIEGIGVTFYGGAMTASLKRAMQRTPPHCDSTRIQPPSAMCCAPAVAGFTNR